MGGIGERASDGLWVWGGYGEYKTVKGKQTKCYKKPYSVLDSCYIANKNRKV